MKLATLAPEDGSNLRLAVDDGAGEPLAAASLWWESTPEYRGGRTGTVGAWQCRSDEAAGWLLGHAGRILKEQGCRHAVGPMNGNTWRSYRFVTWDAGEPAFFLEPSNPPEWPRQWLAAGWSSAARYSSSALSLADFMKEKERGGDQSLERVRRRFAERGLKIRRLDRGRLGEEMAAIHGVSEIAFRDNFLYTPMGREEFLRQYEAIAPLMKEEYILLAEVEGKTAGFVFALPNWPEQKRGEKLRTLVVKTVAILPERSFSGLGTLLVDEVQVRAARDGYERAFHALQHEGNSASLRISDRQRAVPFREYQLFHREL